MSELAGSYASAKKIVPIVLDLVQADSVLDIGCGTGHFLRAFAEAGVDDFLGVDGNYVPREQLVFEERLFRPFDLTSEIDLGRTFDLVVSLEVAEHLPPESADGFVASLVRHAPNILFSAAIPLQGGIGHVNEQWPSYWAKRFEHHGFFAYDIIRPKLRNEKDVEWWYRQNILLFSNAIGHAASSRLAACAPATIELLDRIDLEQNNLSTNSRHKRVWTSERQLWTALSKLQITPTGLKSIDTRLFGGRIRRCYYALLRFLASR